VVFLAFSVFAGYAIPYPKREFLTDDDNEDKSDNNKANNANNQVANHNDNNNNHGPSGAKRVRVAGIGAPAPVQQSNMTGANSGHGMQNQTNLTYGSSNDQQSNANNFQQRY